MTSVQELKALLERVECLVRGDREVDVLLECAFPNHYIERSRPSSVIGKVVSYYANGHHGTWGARYLTSSVDAAVALVERCLPGWDWLARNDEKQGAFANVSPRGQSRVIDEFRCNPVYAPTPALALVSALLSALIAEPRRAE